jgi:hypothetical protein
VFICIYSAVVEGFNIFTGEYVCECFPADGVGVFTEEEMFRDNIPDGMRLSGILGSPDEPVCLRHFGISVRKL